MDFLAGWREVASLDLLVLVLFMSNFGFLIFSSSLVRLRLFLPLLRNGEFCLKNGYFLLNRFNRLIDADKISS